MPRTSDKADRILEYVNQFVQDNGYAPSVREIGAAVGLRSTASVSYHIQALQEKGLLITPDGKGRKRSIVTNVRPGQIPVIGVVTAGVPILAFENQEGTMAWDGEPGCFALRVRGDSMINAGILPHPRSPRLSLRGRSLRPRSLPKSPQRSLQSPRQSPRQSLRASLSSLSLRRTQYSALRFRSSTDRRFSALWMCRIWCPVASTSVSASTRRR